MDGDTTSIEAGSVTTSTSSQQAEEGSTLHVAQSTFTSIRSENQRSRRAKRPRRGQGLAQSQQLLVSQASSRVFLPFSVKEKFDKLEKIIEDGVRLADSLLAVDLSSDFRGSAPTRQVPFIGLRSSPPRRHPDAHGSNRPSFAASGQPLSGQLESDKAAATPPKGQPPAKCASQNGPAACTGILASQPQANLGFTSSGAPTVPPLFVRSIDMSDSQPSLRPQLTARSRLPAPPSLTENLQPSGPDNLVRSTTDPPCATSCAATGSANPAPAAVAAVPRVAATVAPVMAPRVNGTPPANARYGQVLPSGSRLPAHGAPFSPAAQPRGQGYGSRRSGFYSLLHSPRTAAAPAATVGINPPQGPAGSAWAPTTYAEKAAARAAAALTSKLPTGEGARRPGSAGRQGDRPQRSRDASASRVAAGSTRPGNQTAREWRPTGPFVPALQLSKLMQQQ